MKPSLISLACVFAAGVLFERLSPAVPSAVTLVLLAAGATVASLLLARFRRGCFVGVSCAVALLGILRAGSVERSYADLYRRAPLLRELTGIVVSYPDSEPGRTSFAFAPDVLPACVQVTLFWNGEEPQDVVYGDRLRLRGSVKVPPQFPGFDYRTYLAERGVFAVMSVSGSADLERLGTSGSLLLRAGNVLRDRLLRRLDQVLSPDNAALARGLLFGETAGLSDEVADAFRRTGLSHVLAISGMNLAILLAGVWFVLRLLGLRPAVAYPLVGASVLGILWLVGLPVSLVRAAVMFGFLALGSVLADLGFILRRSIRLDHGLAAAALAILAARPGALFDVGFQLSFGATAAIVAWTVFFPAEVRPATGRTPWRGLKQRLVTYAADLIAVSLAAQAGTAPFLAWHFGMLYPLGLLANLIVVPLATLALWVGVIAVFVSATPVFIPAAVVFEALLAAMVWSVRALAQLPCTAVAVPRVFAVWLAGACLYVFATLVVARPAAPLDTRVLSR